MANWKVQSIDSLCLFDQVELKSEQIKALPPGLLKQIRDGLGRAMDRVDPQLGRVSQFSFSTSSNGDIFVCGLYAGNLQEDPALRKALRKALYSAGIHVPESVKRSSPQMIASVNDENKPKGEFNLCVACDANSIGRNVLTAVGKALPLVTCSGFLGGIGSVKVGLDLVRDSKIKYDQSKKIGDKEGMEVALLDGGINGSFLVTGSGMVASFLPGTLDLLPHAVSYTPLPLLLNNVPGLIPFLSGAGSAAMVAMSFFMLASVYHGWSPLSEFRDELKMILDSELPKSEKAARGIRFLKDQFTVPQGASENELEEKWAILCRRVGEETARKIVREVNAGLTEESAIELLHEVDLKSFTTRAKQVSMVVVAVLYILLGIFSFLTPAAILLPIFFAVGAALWFLVDSERVANAVGKLFWRKSSLAL